MQIFYPDLYPIHTIEEKVGQTNEKEVRRTHPAACLESNHSRRWRWITYSSTFSSLISTYWFSWCLYTGYQRVHLHLHWQSDKWPFRAKCFQRRDFLGFTTRFSKVLKRSAQKRNLSPFFSTRCRNWKIPYRWKYTISSRIWFRVDRRAWQYI